MEISVKSKYLKISPRKLRLAVNLVRGRNLQQARNLLFVTNNKGAKMTENLINSAIAIIKESDLDVNKFAISKISCSDAPRLKRGKPASKGSMMAITKRQSHLYLSVSDSSKDVKKINKKDDKPLKKDNKE